MSASRTQRRRLQAAQDEAEKMLEADARYFSRRPERHHYVRRASRAEMKANALANGLETIPTDPGQAWFCVVKQLEPGVRLRSFLQNDADTDTDVSEHEAMYVYELVAPSGSQAQLIETELRAAVAKRRRDS